MLLSSLTSLLTLFTTAQIFRGCSIGASATEGFSGLRFLTPTAEKRLVQS